MTIHLIRYIYLAEKVVCFLCKEEDHVAKFCKNLDFQLPLLYNCYNEILTDLVVQAEQLKSFSALFPSQTFVTLLS